MNANQFFTELHKRLRETRLDQPRAQVNGQELVELKAEFYKLQVRVEALEKYLVGLDASESMPSEQAASQQSGQV